MSPTEISHLMSVSERSIWRYIALFEETGDVKPAFYRHGPPRLLGEYEQLIVLQLIIQHSGIYLYELQERLMEHYSVRVGVSTICRTLGFMGCSRQVIRHVAIQRSDALRAKFMAEISMYDPSMFVWLDESGCDRRNGARKFGYSLRGIRPIDHRMLVRGVRYSAIPIVSLEGVHDVYIFEGTVNGSRFEKFVRKSLLQILMPYNGSNPRSILILDNASIHHVQGVIDVIEQQAKAKIIFLPPYSPDLNPVETVFSKVKSIMKANDALFQVCSCPRALLSMAFGMITIDDCISFISYCGYI